MTEQRLTAATRDVIKHLQKEIPQEVPGAIEATLGRPAAFNGISLSRLLNEHAENTPPFPLNHIGLINTVSELASIELLTNFIKLCPQEIQLKLTRGGPPELFATEINLRNTRFITSALYWALVAVADGSTVHERQKDPYQWDFLEPIATRYSTPVQTPDEYLARVQELVPNPDKPRTTKEPRLIDYLKEYRAFINPLERVCPAIPLTEMILEQWGRQLDTDNNYRERFKSHITP